MQRTPLSHCFQLWFSSFVLFSKKKLVLSHKCHVHQSGFQWMRYCTVDLFWHAFKSLWTLLSPLTHFSLFLSYLIASTELFKFLEFKGTQKQICWNLWSSWAAWKLASKKPLLVLVFSRQDKTFLNETDCRYSRKWDLNWTEKKCYFEKFHNSITRYKHISLLLPRIFEQNCVYRKSIGGCLI